MSKANNTRGVHPLTFEFCGVLDEMEALHMKKGADYGRAEDPFANVRASERFGIPGWVGAMLRANDKMVRIQKAALQAVRGEPIELANETLEDSLIDLAVYAAIAIVLLREQLGLIDGSAHKPEPPTIEEALDLAIASLEREAPQGPEPEATSGGVKKCDDPFCKVCWRLDDEPEDEPEAEPEPEVEQPAPRIVGCGDRNCSLCNATLVFMEVTP